MIYKEVSPAILEDEIMIATIQEEPKEELNFSFSEADAPGPPIAKPVIKKIIPQPIQRSGPRF